MSDGKGQVHQLALVERFGEQYPSRIANLVAINQVIGGLQQRRFCFDPVSSGWKIPDSGDFFKADPSVHRIADVIVPFIGRLYPPRNAQDNDFQLAGIQAVGHQEMFAPIVIDLSQ
jgi:hypothetical protein